MYRDDKIRAIKGIKRLTNEDLAEITGLSRHTVSLICEGKVRDVKLSSLMSIAQALGLPMWELFEPERSSTSERAA